MYVVSEEREENRIFTRNERKIGNDRGNGGHSKEVIHTLMTCHLHDRVMRGIFTHKKDINFFTQAHTLTHRMHGMDQDHDGRTSTIDKRKDRIRYDWKED